MFTRARKAKCVLDVDGLDDVSKKKTSLFN